jgi:splicing factor 3A subunit 2
VEIKKFVKIGRPGYRVTKQRDPENGQQSLLYEVDYPEIAEGVVPRHRFMSAYEQKVNSTLAQRQLHSNNEQLFYLVCHNNKLKLLINCSC